MIDQTELETKTKDIINTLCVSIGERSVGSEGNKRATDFFAHQFRSLTWQLEEQPFDAMDWHHGGAQLVCDGTPYDVQVSPYSLGCDVTAELVPVQTLDELEGAEISDLAVLLLGEIAQEQLMPKNFVFYNPEHHQRIISLLETKNPCVVVCATGRNAGLAGGVYPFPLIEDGDFDIPSIYMTEEEGLKLRECKGREIAVVSNSRRIPGTGVNVVARKGGSLGSKLVVTAHIDAKKGTPGAIDNATGVAVLLLLAEMLDDYIGALTVELVAFNGEDYYAVSGQMEYISRSKPKFKDVLLNINIDGAGFHEGESAASCFKLPEIIEKHVGSVLDAYPGIVEGVPWYQGDHSIFLQSGRPALAVSSRWFVENVDDQDITHTPKDNPGIVDVTKVAEIARFLDQLIRTITSAE